MTRMFNEVVSGPVQTALGDAGSAHRPGLALRGHGRSAPCAPSLRPEGGRPSRLLAARGAEDMGVLFQELVQRLTHVDSLGHTSDLRESPELLDNIRIVVGRDLLLLPLVFAHHKKIPINCLLLLAVAGSISYMKSTKDATMSKPRIAILTLVALATLALAACSRPGSAYVGAWVGPHGNVALISRHGHTYAIQEQGHTEVDYYHLDAQGDLTDGLAVVSINRAGDLTVRSPFGDDTMHRGHRLSPAALRALEARQKARQAKAAPMPPL